MVALLFSGLSGCATIQDLNTKEPYEHPYERMLSVDHIRVLSDEDLFYGLSAPNHQVPERVKDMYRREMLFRNPEWSHDIREAILTSAVSIGMSKDQVLASQGLPRFVLKSADNDFTHEVWEYGLGPKKHAFFLRDGNVTFWKENFTPKSYRDF